MGILVERRKIFYPVFQLEVIVLLFHASSSYQCQNRGRRGREEERERGRKRGRGGGGVREGGAKK